MCDLVMQVLHNVGLCIVLHDITHVGDAYIFPGDGASHTKGVYCTYRPIRSLSHSYIHTVRFRFVVFRPFVNEVLVGKIRSCNQEGVRGDECLIPIHITAISSCSVSGLL